MSLLESAKLWVVYCLVPYGLLSAMIYSFRFVSALQDMASSITPFIWIAGPPALLGIDLRSSASPFAIGSILVLVGMLGTIHWARRREPGAYICGTLVVLTWLSFGLLALVFTF